MGYFFHGTYLIIKVSHKQPSKKETNSTFLGLFNRSIKLDSRVTSPPPGGQGVRVGLDWENKHPGNQIAFNRMFDCIKNSTFLKQILICLEASERDHPAR